jgi:Mg-chelatase subunit ChlD
MAALATLVGTSVALPQDPDPSPEIGRVFLRQVAVDLPEVKAYFDVVDGRGEPVAIPRLMGSLAGEELELVGAVPFRDSGEGVAYTFLVDVSASLDEEQFKNLQLAIGSWIDGMTAHDRAAIISFGDRTNVEADFTGDREVLRDTASTLAATDRKTVLFSALRDSVQLVRGRRDLDLPSRRVLIMMSDGIDDGSPLRAEDVLETLEVDRVPLYAVGFSAASGAEARAGLELLGRLAERSGGLYLDGDDGDFQTAFQQAVSSIGQAEVATFRCVACPEDGRTAYFQLTAVGGNRRATDRLQVSLQGRRDDAGSRQASTPAVKEDHGRAVGTEHEEAPTSTWKRRGLWIAALALVLALGLAAWWRMRAAAATRRAARHEEEIPQRVSPVGGPAAAIGAEAPAALPEVVLAVVRGRDRTKKYQVQVGLSSVVGSAPDCDLVITEEDGVEPRHFELSRGADGRLRIRPLTEGRKTWLNGVPLGGPTELRDGNKIKTGATEFAVYLGT